MDLLLFLTSPQMDNLEQEEISFSRHSDLDNVFCPYQAFVSFKFSAMNCADTSVTSRSEGSEHFQT